MPTGIIYGTSDLLPKLLDIQVHTLDQSNMLKAIMCLYLGISIVWILGIFQEKYWTKATELNILFMLTLASGRFLSIMIDGFPTGGYIFGIIAELLIELYSIYQLKKHHKN